jgi:hypothetical protein
LPSIPYTRRGRLPDVPGLYFAVIDDDYVAYVGISTTSIRQRWAAHNRKRSILELGTVRIAFVAENDTATLRAMEREAIAALAPPLNTQHIPPKTPAAPAWSMEGDGSPLVSAKAVVDALAIPRFALYRLAYEGRIPMHDITRGWHNRRQIRFRISEVRTALGMDAPTPPSQP